jgi:hypothetical protein
MTSPDTWTAPDWRDFGWYGVCDCGRLRHEHAVLDDAGMVTDVIARCDAGHEIRIEDIP